MPDGPVYTSVLRGTTLYIGGAFDRMSPITGGGAVLDQATGLALQQTPRVHGGIGAIANDGLGGWFVGGAFDSVGGVPRRNLAHIRADMSVADWNPAPDASVSALARSGPTLYVSGEFTSIGGEARRGVAALDTGTARATGFDAHSDAGVDPIVIGDGVLYVGGAFTTIGGASRAGIAALDTATGLATPWNPNASPNPPSGIVGYVFALALGDGVLYAGGAFTTIGGQPRPNLAALDLATGQATSWNPIPNGNVSALATAGGVVYVGGSFFFMNGFTRPGLAALDASDAHVTPWDPRADVNAGRDVEALAVSGGLLYVGGGFAKLGGASRSNLAALDTATALAVGWDPQPDKGVGVIAADGNTICVGGGFSYIGGSPRNNLAALDIDTGEPTSWNPRADLSVFALANGPDVIYAGGFFRSIGGQPRNFLAALDTAEGLPTPWNPGANSFVRALAVSGDRVYVGGNFTSVSGQPRSRIAAVDTVLGQALPWNPGSTGGIGVYGLAVVPGKVYACGDFFLIGGQAHSNLAALDTITGRATSWSPGPNAVVFNMALSDGKLYAAGNFTTVGATGRNFLAAIDTATGLPTAWDPSADHTVRAIAARNGTIYAAGDFVSIGGRALRYAAALDTATGRASPWNPGLGVTAHWIALDHHIRVGFESGTSGLASFTGFPVVGFSSDSLACSCTVGDTALASFNVRNTGLLPLELAPLGPPIPGATSLTPEAAQAIMPGASAGISLEFRPRAPLAREHDDLFVASTDPFAPLIRIPSAFEALDLTAQTRTVTGSDPAPLGEAVVVQVIPEPGHRIETVSVLYRPTGDPAFTRLQLAANGGGYLGIIPGSSVTEHGLEYYFEYENSGIVVADPRGAPQDTILRIPVAAPTSISVLARPTSRSDFLSDSLITIEAQLPAGSAFQSGSIHYRRGGAATYVSTPLARSDRPDVVTGVIPGEVVGARGIEYWVEVATLKSSTPLTFPRTTPAALPATIQVAVRNLVEPTPHEGGRYRLLGIPLDCGPQPPDIASVLSNEFGTYDPVQWRLFRWLGRNVELPPVDASGQFRSIPGRGFWLISRRDHQLDTSPVAGVSTESHGEFPIALDPGWNQIADPFDFPVAWTSVRRSGLVEGPQAYTPGNATPWSSVDVLRPFEGYFVFNGAPSSAPPETIWVQPTEWIAPTVANGPADGGSSTGAIDAATRPWSIVVQATSDGRADESRVGFDPHARDGYDPLDVRQPPAPPGPVLLLSVVHPEWADRPGLYRQDVRPLHAGAAVWEFEVRSAVPGEPVRLELRTERPLPSGLVLIDHEVGSAIDLRGPEGSLPSYRILSKGPGRPYRFALVAGAADSVAELEEAMLEVPARLALDPAVPNPSRDANRIRYALPRPAPVTLEVFDVMGKRVVTLLDHESQAAGYHALLWDGSTQRGARAPSGVYFLRLAVSGTMLQRRIVRLN
jgi:hypothetical protein